MPPNANYGSSVPTSDFPSWRVQKNAEIGPFLKLGPVSHCLGTRLHTGVRYHLANDPGQESRLSWPALGLNLALNYADLQFIKLYMSDL